MSSLQYCRRRPVCAALILGLALIAIGPIPGRTQGDSPVPFSIKIGWPGFVVGGDTVSLPVTKVGGSQGIYGYDFLFGYEAAVLTVLGVTSGILYDTPGDYEWEYFTYRIGDNGGCGTDCPTGLLRVVSLSDINNGSHHPLQYIVPDSTELFTINFRTSSDTAYQCTLFPVRFYWIDCGDNMIVFDDSTGIGNAISDTIYDFDGDNITSPGGSLPSYYGVPNSCITDTSLNGPTRFITFKSGAVDIACSGTIDDRGDINLNGIAYELADAVVFYNYFMYGLSAFTINVDGQIAASEINGDGIPLTIQDIVYLIRVIVGDLLPLPSPPSSPGSGDFAGELYLYQTDTSIIVRTYFEDSVGGMYLSFLADSLESYRIRVYPGVDSVDVGYNVSEGLLKILILRLPYWDDNWDEAVIDSGLTDVLEIVYSGETPALAHASAAGFLAEHVDLSVQGTPDNPPGVVNYPTGMVNDYYGGFYYDFEAEDGDVLADPLVFHLLSGPGTIDPETGVWRYAPLCVDVGTEYVLEICASDPAHECPQADIGLHAFVNLTVDSTVPRGGDVDYSGTVNLTDIVYIIDFLYHCGPPPVGFTEVGDVNADGRINLLDVVYLIIYLFKGGPPPVCP
jgi:hypothetical protein